MKTRHLFIAAADIHLRSDAPRGRRPAEFQAAMWRKFDQILGFAGQFDVPLLIAGDLGEYPYWPNRLLTQVIRRFRRGSHAIIFTPGQHDLPEHRLAAWEDAALGVIEAAKGNFHLMMDNEDIPGVHGCAVRVYPFGHPIEHATFDTSDGQRPKVAIAHQMVIDQPLWPGQEAIKGHQLLQKFPEFDIIITGDNHQPFVHTMDDQILINPGSMMRSRRDQMDHRPRVYLVSQEPAGFTATPLYLDILNSQDVFLEEIDAPGAELDGRIEAFVARVKEKGRATVSFTDNLRTTLASSPVAEGVKNKVLQAVETVDTKRGVQNG